MISSSLLMRLCRARDLLQESRGTVRVVHAAREAALSPYHFIRLYRATFGQTPHQALIDARLDRAKQLLVAADLSVTQVCLEVGFASLGSFSSLFTRRIGSFACRVPAARPGARRSAGQIAAGADPRLLLADVGLASCRRR